MAISATKTLQLITKYGASATLRTFPSSVYDRDTGTTTLGDPTDYSVMVVPEDQEMKIPGDADVVLYLSPSGLSVTPSVGDHVIYSGQTWTVLRALPTDFKGQTVLWTLVLKGVAT